MESDPLANFEFLTEVPGDLYCGICKEVAVDPRVTQECGHLFCLECVERCLAASNLCPMCRYEGFQVRTDHRARRQIGDLKVLCKYTGCGWQGAYTDIGRHQASCRNRPVQCEFQFVGCATVLQPGDVHQHEVTEAAKHVRLLAVELQKERQRKEVSEDRGIASQREMDSLKEQVRAMRCKLDEQTEELELLRTRVARDGEQTRDDLCELRRHINTRRPPSDDFQPLESLVWADCSVTEKFSFSEGRKTATLVTPGWCTLYCPTGLSRGKWVWGVRLGVADYAEYTSSTIMVGVTVNKGAVSTHLGNISDSWCFQDNGFCWDGTQCYAYGESTSAGDCVRVLLDLDEGVITFAVNQKTFSHAFKNVGGLVYPAVSLCKAGHQVTLC
eukprot:TRINITY_DN18297_c0_g1_i1.p1 TRINITY_DN18297_c0_g1~~TRINITY_DN18297_c0_g1_i1.p1  ORF type:complete len:403 (+),score=93.14 TRINITY_DN18297_c0_g1_i1:53-1210(+)